MKLKVGVPFAKHGRITEPTLQSLRDLSRCKDFEVQIITQQGSNVPRARNAMINGEKSNRIHQKLEGFDWFLSVDADTAFSVDHVKQLLAHDLDVVSGAYLHKHDTSRIVAGWFPEVDGISSMSDRVGLDETGLIEVDWVGAGFLLFRREALERAAYPWFTSIEIQFQTDEGDCAQVVSDDIGMCMKLKQAGQKIMLDADCRVEHVPHPNEYNPATALSDALNDLLRSRETIIRHIRAMNEENRKLKEIIRGAEEV